MIAIPDIREISLDGGEDFLIIACDGLWDFVSEDAAAQEVYYKIAENPGKIIFCCCYSEHFKSYLFTYPIILKLWNNFVSDKLNTNYVISVSVV